MAPDEKSFYELLDRMEARDMICGCVCFHRCRKQAMKDWLPAGNAITRVAHCNDFRSARRWLT
jgi:hypothetical protein